ncbi:MAG: hypothetical protein WKF34_09585 [Pyrinomonadaceae bacterium]
MNDENRTRIEAAFGQQASATGDRVGKNALLNEKIETFMQLKRTLSSMVPNVLTGQTAPIAAWTSAAHVEEPPKKKAPPTP